LKTVGLMALMGQSGLHIPAEAGSQISFFDSIYADIGDEQSIEQSLSTFSGHVTNIIHLLKEADPQSLVILDELGAGTDPQEGAALARALLDHLVQRGITTLVATHYPELKTYAHATKGVVNASVEFDLKTLAPTYHLTVGLPGRSNALAIAKRLGLPKDVIEAARSSINPADLKAEDLLDEIHRERDRTRQARARVEESQRAAQVARAELAERLEKIEDERVDLLEKARRQGQNELDSLREEIGKLRAEVARLQAAQQQSLAEKSTLEQTKRDLDAAQQRLARLSQDIPKPRQDIRGPAYESLSSNDVRLANAMYEATVDPMSIFEDYQRGTVDYDKIQYAWKQYPGLQQACQAGVIDMLTVQMGDPDRAAIPDTTLTQIDYFFGFGGTLQPSVSAALGRNMTLAAGPEQQEQQQQGRPLGKMPTADLTPIGRMMQGRG